jgi:hypothetical protein
MRRIALKMTDPETKYSRIITLVYLSLDQQLAWGKLMTFKPQINDSWLHKDKVN